MGDIKIDRITLGIYGTNCYFIYRTDTKDAIVVDPADSGDFIFDELTKKGLSLKAILLTHGHFDHIYGVASLKEKSGVPVYAFEAEAGLLGDTDMNLSASFGRKVTVVPDVLLKDGEETDIFGLRFRTIHTPGHTVGSACFYFEEASALIAGDTLFAESVGRTDFPTGSMSRIVRSITEKLMVLPNNVKVYPGHGDYTSIGYERDYNPYIN